MFVNNNLWWPVCFVYLALFKDDYDVTSQSGLWSLLGLSRCFWRVTSRGYCTCWQLENSPVIGTLINEAKEEGKYAPSNVNSKLKWWLFEWFTKMKWRPSNPLHRCHQLPNFKVMFALAFLQLLIKGFFCKCHKWNAKASWSFSSPQKILFWPYTRSWQLISPLHSVWRFFKNCPIFTKS